MKLRFYGGSRMVTGSNHLIEANGKILMLDCGLIQGGKEEDLMNFKEFPYNPSDVDYLVLSHAHIDHSGRIPKLVNDGFKGRIIATKATTELSKIMLQDSGHIQESEAEWENKKRQRKNMPLVKPLYTVDDALRALTYFEEYYYDQYVEIDDTFTIRFKDAGHIIGSSIVEIWVKENNETTKIVFSGDLGVDEKAIINTPEFIESADYLILESTYGNRIHEPYQSAEEELIKIIEDTAARGGSVIIPAFAVGRTQELIYQLNKYYDRDDFEEYKRIPIYIDSPMALRATEMYEKNAELFNEETKERILSGDNPFRFPNIRYVQTSDESKALNKSNYPKVIISASGMADAGRIRHHLKHNLWDSRNTVLFVGYQAQGSTGRRLLEGQKEINILGEEIRVSAEIREIQGLSAHADKNMLLRWVEKIENKPKKIFLVHGEIDALEEMEREIEARFKIEADITEPGEVVEVTNTDAVILSKDHTEKNLKEDLDASIQEVLDLLEVYKSKRGEDLPEDFIKSNYFQYNGALLDVKNRLMELIMLENN